MAEKNSDNLQEELEALKTENAELRKKTKKSDHTGVIIRGAVTIEMETPGGKKEKKKMKYTPGYYRTRLPDGRVVKSQALLDLANGKQLTEKQLTDNPQLAGITKDQAYALYEKWALKGVSFLVEA